MKMHHYDIELSWTGNTDGGTSSYGAYSRDYELRAPSKTAIAGSSDPHFRGNARRWNPEELLVASLSACHQLWYLHLCAEAGVVVLAYEDQPHGIMAEQPDGAGQFVSVLLQPLVTISTQSDLTTATRLHDDAHAKCFIARSVNFPVTHKPKIERSSEG